MAEAEEYRTKLRRGELLPPSKLTFGEVADEFLRMTEALVTTGERSQRTLDLYRQRYRTHIEPSLGRKRIQDVRAEHIGVIYARLSHLILGLNLNPVQVAKIAGHSSVSVTLNTYADEFDKAMHQSDLFARIEQAGFGSVNG
jgi:hypothetical protein